jgi:hypothetical protein
MRADNRDTIVTFCHLKALPLWRGSTGTFVLEALL